MNLKGRKVLVTGAEGFIGSHLVEKLVNLGAEVTALVQYNEENSWGWIDTFNGEMKKNIRVVMGDILEYDSIKKITKGHNVVFHLAAIKTIPYSYYSPSQYIKTNIEGTGNVMEACLELGVDKVIHTSARDVYGEAQYTPIDESHPLLGKSPYAASKTGADKIVECFFRSYNLPAAVIRPFDTYGPRQSARAVVPNIISQIYSGKREIRLGSEADTWDFTYVKDMASAFIRVAESERTIGEVINAGCGCEVSLGELASSIVKISGRKVRIVFDKEDQSTEGMRVRRFSCDNTKIKALTGWVQLYSMETGLMETIEWLKKNINLYKEDMYNI